MKEYEWKFMGLEGMYVESNCQMELCGTSKRFLSYTLLETRCEIKT